MCDEIGRCLGLAMLSFRQQETSIPSPRIRPLTIQRHRGMTIYFGLVIAYQGDTDHLKETDPAQKLPMIARMPYEDQIESIHKIAQVLQFLREAVDKTFLQPNKTESLYEVCH